MRAARPPGKCSPGSGTPLPARATRGAARGTLLGTFAAGGRRGRHPGFADEKAEILGGARLVQGHGKDRIIFVTKEDHETPSNAELVADDPNDPYEEHGLILPNGDINWNCPCLGGMASGPCGEQFKSAFSCFHYSTEEVKGSDCVAQFRAMQECMQKYPDLYPQEDEEEEEEKKPAEPLEERAPTEAAATTEEEGSS
nr:PREDICTED: mitochondrial intermembrane space import and assembly protein 40 isoform X1 [Equus przewalskii]